jgi:hypothetical protein
MTIFQRSASIALVCWFALACGGRPSAPPEHRPISASGGRAADHEKAPEASSPTVGICVLVDGRLVDVSSTIDPLSGDTLIGALRLQDAFPAERRPYAAGMDWYVQHTPLKLLGFSYVKDGVPQVIPREMLTRVADHDGVPLFAEAGLGSTDVLYLPIGPGCVFQRYTGRGPIGTGPVGALDVSRIRSNRS